MINYYNDINEFNGNYNEFYKIYIYINIKRLNKKWKNILLNISLILIIVFITMFFLINE